MPSADALTIDDGPSGHPDSVDVGRPGEADQLLEHAVRTVDSRVDAERPERYRDGVERSARGDQPGVDAQQVGTAGGRHPERRHDVDPGPDGTVVHESP